MSDVEVKVRVLHISVSIAASTMLAQKLGIRILIGVLLGSEEQHVLQEVSQPRSFGRVAEVTNANIQAS